LPSRFTAVCGGIYLSTLPNCSSGPDILTVVDTYSGVAAFYFRSPGPAFEPIQDTEALANCP